VNSIAASGAFSKQDIKDISDTVHQGALLTLESGVIPLDPAEIIPVPPAAQDAVPRNRAASDGRSAVVAPSRPQEPASEPTEVLKSSSPVEKDEHYERYLKEREAMLRSSGASGSGAVPNGQPDTSGSNGQGKEPVVDKSRKDAVDDLLKSLGQSRGH